MVERVEIKLGRKDTTHIIHFDMKSVLGDRIIAALILVSSTFLPDYWCLVPMFASLIYMESVHRKRLNFVTKTISHNLPNMFERLFRATR